MYTETSRVLTRVLVLLVLLGALGPAQSAWAANPSDEGCNQDDECRDHFQKGQGLYKQQNYTDALKEFQTAYDRRQTPILLANIGRTLQKLGRPKEALEYYERCVAAAKSDPGLQEKVKLYIEETKPLVSSSAPPPPDPNIEPQPAPLTPVTPVEPPKPVYKRKWFIAVMVVGAVVVAGAITTGIIFGTKPSPQPDPPLDPGVMVLRPMF
jgi:hypothetical protein